MKKNAWLRAFVAASLATCVSAFTLGSTLSIFSTARTAWQEVRPRLSRADSPDASHGLKA